VINWAYIAGFFDGEGNIAIKRHSRNWGYGFPLCRTVQAGDRGFRILTKIKDFLEVEEIRSRISVKRDSAHIHQDCYDLSIDGWLGVNKFLTFLLPYLEVKRTEAQDILRYRRLYPRPPQRDALLKGWVTRRANRATQC